MGVKNVCLSKRKKKSAELWDSVPIYRGQKTLKNRYGRLGFESVHILLRKGRKGCLIITRRPLGQSPQDGNLAFQMCRLALQKCWIGSWRLNALSCSGAIWSLLLGFFGRSLYLDVFSTSVYDFLSIFWIIQAFLRTIISWINPLK